MPSAKYRDELDGLGHAMPWPSDFLARLLVAPQQLTPEQMVRLSEGNNRTPSKGVSRGGGVSPNGADAAGRVGSDNGAVPSSARIVSQALSNMVWGSLLTLACLLLFQVGFTNKLAIAIFTPAVIVSFVIALGVTRFLGNGSTTPLMIWHFSVLIGFQLTIMLSFFKCLALEATGARSFTIVALSMCTMLFSTEVGLDSLASYSDVDGISPPTSPSNGLSKKKGASWMSFLGKWGWLIATSAVQCGFYIALAIVDLYANCDFSTNIDYAASPPNLSVVLFFQQILPVMLCMASAARVYEFTFNEMQQRLISEEFAIKCLRATIQRDVTGLVIATEEYDQNPPAIPSMRDDALHMVVSFLHSIATQPTLVAPLTPHTSVVDDLRPFARTSSDLNAQQRDNKSPLQRLKVTHLQAIHSSSAGTSETENVDSSFPVPQENQPDRFSNAASDVRRQRAQRLGSIHGNLGLNSAQQQALESPNLNSGTPTRPSTSNSQPIGIQTARGYIVLFALPKLSAYMMSTQKSLNMAEMFLGEFSEVVQIVLEKWSGVVITHGFNYVTARFNNLALAVAASIEAQTRMQNNSGHHRDITLNMLGAHKMLTLTVVGEVLFGRPTADSKWAFGYSAVEKIFDSAIQAFSRENLPANIIATNLTSEVLNYFDFAPSPIHVSLMNVIKAIETKDGYPVLSPAAMKVDESKVIELLDLPMLEAAIPKYRPSHTTSETSRLQKTKSLAIRPPSGRSHSAVKVRKGLPPQVIEVWNTIDIDGNGYLDLEEMEALIKKIGLPMNKLEIRDFFKKIDVDNSNSLSIEEFEDAYYSTTLGGASVISSIRRAAMAMSHSNEREFISLVEKSWRKYDVDKSGKLDQTEVGRILRDLGMNHSAEEIKWMFDRMDKDKSGFVEFDEFMSLFSADSSEFMAVRERIQAVGRVMTKTDIIYSTPDQAMRDHRVKILNIVNTWSSPLIFAYIWYTFCSTIYYITLGPDLAPVTLTQSIVNILIDCIYAVWCIAKLVYLPKESRGTVTFKGIWKHHIRTVECWVDMITIVPVDLVYFALGDSLNGGLISYYRANKLLCIFHLDDRYTQLSKKFNPAMARALNALMMFFVFCHILCCALIAVTRVIGDDTTEPLLGINRIFADDAILYLSPLYWAILTLSGQLSGASVPELDTHLFLLMAAVLVGLPLYTVVLGTIGNAVTVEDSYTRYLDKIDVLRSFFEYTRLSKDFENDIIDYYKHLYATTGTLDITENPLEELPMELSIPVVIAMGRDMLKSVPIFKDASANLEFVHELTIKLVPKVIEPLAVVMRKGEIGAEMYFITFGNFNIVIDTGKIVFTLGKGNFFGEIALLHSGKRTATIVNSHRFGNVLMLVKDQFQEVARFFPDCLSQVYKAAEERIRQTKENEQKEKEAAEKAAKEAKEKERAEAALKAKEANGGVSPEAGKGLPGDGSVSDVDQIGASAVAVRQARRKSLVAEADESPRQHEDNASPAERNQTSRSDSSYTKPSTPSTNDPVRTNLNNGMDTTQMTMQFNSIGFAMAVNPEVYNAVPVVPDSAFDAETRPNRRPGAAVGRRRSSHNGNGSGSSTTNPNATCSDFDDEEEESITEGSTRSHSTLMNSDENGGVAHPHANLPPTAPASMPPQPGTNHPHKLPDVPTQL